MGEVYRAEDTTLKRQVALKVLPAELAASQDRLERFQREAETLAAIDHPNIVHIYSVESATVGEGLAPNPMGHWYSRLDPSTSVGDSSPEMDSIRGPSRSRPTRGAKAMHRPNGHSMLVSLTTLLALALVSQALSPLFAGEGRTVGKSPLDHATVFQDTISREVPVRIRPFSTEDADLGTGAKKNKPKYQQIAKEMQETAPGLLQTGLIQNLKELGFVDVEPVDGAQPIPEECYVIEGEFTVLNPGSQAKRYWAGFGAGKSRVCSTGRVVDAEGNLLLEFDHCRHEAMGLFGGESEGQMAKDSHATGAHLAEFMAKWADGDYAQ